MRGRRLAAQCGKREQCRPPPMLSPPGVLMQSRGLAAVPLVGKVNNTSAAAAAQNACPTSYMRLTCVKLVWKRGKPLRTTRQGERGRSPGACLRGCAPSGSAALPSAGAQASQPSDSVRHHSVPLKGMQSARTSPCACRWHGSPLIGYEEQIPDPGVSAHWNVSSNRKEAPPCTGAQQRGDA